MKGYVNLTHTNNSAIEKVSQKVDEIQDDYVSKDTTELTNYYTKSQTYTKEEIDNKTTNVYRAKGSVQTYQDLPTTNNQVGDVYNVIEAYNDYPAGTNFVWTDTSTWDALGGEISVIQGVSQEDFDALVNNETQIVNDDNTFKAGGTRNLKVNPLSAVIIGNNADSGNFGVAIGRQANNILNSSIAIGNNSTTSQYYAIQLGEGRNNIEHSLQIEDDNIYKANTHKLTVQNAEINGTPAYGVLSGTSAPTTTTVGAVGQFYLDTTNKQLYQCVSLQTQTVDEVDTTIYEWQEVGGGSSGTKKYQHNVNFSNSSNYNLKIYFSYISDKSTSSMNITALLEDIKNTYSFIRLIANGIFKYADVFYNISNIQLQNNEVYAYGFDNTGNSQFIPITSGAIGITDTVVEI